MKSISFSCVEKLPALLNKSCSQTIRPAWKEDISSEGVPMGYNLDKPPYLKVGEKFQLMWKQRSKARMFFKSNGSPCIFVMPKEESHRVFNKLLGTGIITEVFEIEMWIGNDAPLITGYQLKDTYELAKRDGFKSDKKYIDFYKFFIKYNLDNPKKFYVYRWKWE